VALTELSDYARALRPALGADLFNPAPSRLGWLAAHVAVAAAGIALVAAGVGGPLLALALVVPLGLAYAGMAFVAHEALHGAVVRGSAARKLVGGLAFLPFCISPRHWIAWHNRMHHGNTMRAGVDPDAYPTLAAYGASRKSRVADRLAFGGRRLAGLVTLVIGLNVQSAEVLLGSGPRARYLPRAGYALALVETAAALAFWVGLGLWLGPWRLACVWLAPLAVANVVVMAHIVTNHSLSPLTDVNDPLVNSLSVTAPRWFERYTLDFGLHVEHHLFPAASSRQLGRVRDLLVARWPERYQSLPLGRALALLFRSGRIYRTPTRLIDPRTGAEVDTLGAQGRADTSASTARACAVVGATSAS
jgi:fatty acid desaturase